MNKIEIPSVDNLLEAHHAGLVYTEQCKNSSRHWIRASRAFHLKNRHGIIYNEGERIEIVSEPL